MRKYFFGKNASISWIKKKISKNTDYNHNNIDIRNFNAVKKIIKSNKDISAIIHCAAQPYMIGPKKNSYDFDGNARYSPTWWQTYCKKSSFVYVNK